MVIALVGATGVVGEQILEQFIKRSFPVGELRLFASEGSDGDFIDFAGDSLLVGHLTEESFEDVDLAIFATPSEVSSRWSPVAASAGVVCIDLSAAGRLESSSNLLVAGVNDGQLRGTRVSTPDSLTVLLALLLNALGTVVKLRSVLVTAVVPASGQGRKGLAELQDQAGELLNGRPVVNKVFSSQLAFNCLPAMDSSREKALADELRLVLGLDHLDIHINRLQLPIFYGEGAFVRVEFSSEVTAEQLKKVLDNDQNFELQNVELPGMLDVVGEDELQVTLGSVTTEPKTVFDLWCAADNVGRCSAGNTVRLAEMLTARMEPGS